MAVRLVLADLQGDVSLPMYQRIKQTIQYKIRRGEWPPGAKIPSENQLAADLMVSRMTINRPFRELTAEGVLKRVQGVGTFVAEPVQQASLLELRSIADEIEAQGKTHRAEVLLLEAVPASAFMAKRFGISAGEPLFHVVVTHFQDEVPIQVEDRYVSPALVPDFMQVDFTRITPTAFLISQVKPDEMEHIVQAVMPDSVLRGRLAIAEGEPCLRLQRRTWKGNTVVTSVDLTYPSSRYGLSARYKP